MALLLWQLSRSHLGRSWRAIREDETAALTVSIRADHYKALAFGLSAAIAGLGGALIAHFYGYISYDSFLAPRLDPGADDGGARRDVEHPGRVRRVAAADRHARSCSGPWRSIGTSCTASCCCW